MKTKDQKTLYIVTAVCGAFVILFALGVMLVFFLARGGESAEDPRVSLSEVRGVWIASVFNIDFPSAPDLDADALRGEIDAIVENAASLGLNTICFQVRPSADALYDSDIFPVSAYLSADRTLTLDALAYMVQAAHAKHIAVFAWVNPLRVTGSASGRDSLPEKHPAALHPEWAVEYADGRLYFDCGIPAVRELIADGVREIVKNYAVDGVIFDDYFYPYPVTVEVDEKDTVAAFADDSTFAEYGKDFEDIGDFRRDCVNQMVQLCYETVKSENIACAFGVAPFGIWKNGYGGESGSETRGAQSYSDIYCDTLAWVQGGYIDFAAPQLYWRTTDSAAPYDILCDWWAQALAETDVQLLICHGAYRYDSDWEDPEGTLTAQVEYAGEKEVYGGSLFYGYEELRENIHGAGDEVRKLYK